MHACPGFARCLFLAAHSQQKNRLFTEVGPPWDGFISQEEQEAENISALRLERASCLKHPSDLLRHNNAAGSFN